MVLAGYALNRNSWNPRALMTTSVNPTASTIETAANSIIMGPLLNAAEASLIAQFPFLGLPVINQIFTFLVNLYGNKLMALMDTEIDMATVGLLNSEHQQAFQNAVTQLRIVAANKGTSSQEFQDAKKQAELAMVKFTNYNT